MAVFEDGIAYVIEFQIRSDFGVFRVEIPGGRRLPGLDGEGGGGVGVVRGEVVP